MENLVKPVKTLELHAGFILFFRDNFQGLFQDSKIHINPFTPKVSKLIFPYCLPYISYFLLDLTDFQNFAGPVAFFQDFPVLENATVKFQDFPGFPGPVWTLCIQWSSF